MNKYAKIFGESISVDENVCTQAQTIARKLANSLSSLNHSPSTNGSNQMSVNKCSIQINEPGTFDEKIALAKITRNSRERYLVEEHRY